MSFRDDVIRLAHEIPELRAHLVPILRKEGQEKTARVTMEKLRLKYQDLGDFGGTDPVVHKWVLEVGGPTFDYKSDLARLGLRWDKMSKTWRLDATEYAYMNTRRRREFAKNRATQERAYPALRRLVDQQNREADEYNATLREGPQDTKALVKEVLRFQRQTRFLGDLGLEVTYQSPNRYSVDEPMMAITGDTFPVKRILSRYGFRWDGRTKSWLLPSDDWNIIRDNLARDLAIHHREVSGG